MRYWIAGIVIVIIAALGVATYWNAPHGPQQQQRGIAPLG